MTDSVRSPNPDEVAREIEKALYAAMQDEMNYSARSAQAAEFKVGVSDLGFCPERTRRMLDQQVPEDIDMLPAWIGTWLGTGMEAAAKRQWPDAILQSDVEVRLQGETREYVIGGHPDIILPEGILLDGKTDYGLTTVERTGPSKQQRFQRHLYALGAFMAGMFDEGVELEDVMVGNVWMDRAGIDRRLHADVEKFSWEVVREAGEWLDEVVYAFLHGEEAEKAPPREMCAVVCGFYRVCRLHDTDVEGLITDDVTVTAASMYREGLDLERQGRKLKDEAKQHLRGIQGSTGQFFIRWTHINATVVPEQERSGYDRLEVRPITKKEQP
jgi:hypothetical protein